LYYLRHFPCRINTIRFYKPIPESHEQARNIMADCKTQEFIDALEDKGVEPRRRSTGRGFTGIALKVRTPK
jgi:hypothetical protein